MVIPARKKTGSCDIFMHPIRCTIRKFNAEEHTLYTTDPTKCFLSRCNRSSMLFPRLLSGKISFLFPDHYLATDVFYICSIYHYCSQFAPKWFREQNIKFCNQINFKIFWEQNIPKYIFCQIKVCEQKNTIPHRSL